MSTLLRIYTLTTLILAGSLIAGNSGVPLKEFEARRVEFVELTDELDALTIFNAAPMVERNHDVEYPYRQDSDFFYLTAWEYPNATLLIHNAADGPRFHFFVQPRFPKYEVWTGPRKGVAEARLMLPDVDVHPISEFHASVDSLFRMQKHLILSLANDHELEVWLDSLIESRAFPRDSILVAVDHTRELRLYKSRYEISELQKAIDITGMSLIETFKQIPRLNYEYEVEALIEYGFNSRGAERLGFPSIVGSGINATYLHYSDNNQRLDHDGLILMDVGAEWGYYSADISRTVPVDGSFNPAQRELYNLVMQAQQKAIESVKPGASFREPHNVAVAELTRGLLEIGLLEGELDSLIARSDYRRFFMHGTSHWLGLDVHDAGGYKNAGGNIHLLQPGMVLTVEPGLYISPGQTDVPEQYWGIGIRIEDDVLVTDTGYEVLSRNIPSDPDEIEKLMQSKRRFFQRGK